MSELTLQRATTNVVSTTEWRWVIIFAGLLVAVGLLPYAWAFTGSTGSDYSFTGILYNPIDGATLLAKMELGARGAWLFNFPYTPEQTQGVLVHSFYLMLGSLAKLLGFSPLLMFHLARLVAGFMMFASLYHLGSTIWGRLRPRRLFFFMLSVGSGLGWLILTVSRGTNTAPLPDLNIPESIPFYASLVNPHFPLAIAMVASLASMCVVIFRPGFNTEPTLTNGGASLVVLTFALVVIEPFAWLPIALGIVVYLWILILRSRRIPVMELRWASLMLLPALPVIAYYLVALNGNPAFWLWNRQSDFPNPPLLNMLVGFGLPLIVAIPGLIRAVRRFERDGDRFMLVWLVVNSLLLYFPISFQQRLTIGMFIPITYFAVRSLEDYWFFRISPAWRLPALIALFVFMMPSNILAAGVPLFGVQNSPEGLSTGLLLPREEAAAIQWLRAEGQSGEVVLAPINVSLWIPAYTPLRVVYGHPTETLNAALHNTEVTAWYAGFQCQEIIALYKVRYILTKSADSPCLVVLGLREPIVRFGETRIYRVP